MSALEYAADVKADVVGKPEPGFFQQALSDINCDAESAVMIGDVSHNLFFCVLLIDQELTC